MPPVSPGTRNTRLSATRIGRGTLDVLRSAAMSLTVDVVVVAYNRYDLTESCLRHVAAQTREHRLIVCDNGSTDGAGERVAADWPDGHAPAHGHQSRLRGGVQPAVAAGDGDAIVLLNNDVDCRPDFVERVVAPLEADPARRLGRRAVRAARRRADRLDRADDGPHAEPVPAPPGTPGRPRPARPTPVAGGAGGHRSRLPARRVGARRRPRRADLRVRRGLRPGDPPARRRLGRGGRARRRRRPPRLRHARAPNDVASASTAASGAPT